MNITINKKKINLSYVNIYSLLIAITALLYLNPYFIWDTYKDGTFSFFKPFFLLIAYATTPLTLILQKHTKVTPEKILLMFLFIFLQIYMLGVGDTGSIFSVGNIAFLTYISCLILLQTKIQNKIYYYFSWIFALSLIVPIIIWFFILMGIEIPHNVILPWEEIKVANKSWYDHYFFAIFRRETWGRQLVYLNGIFDEQGIVGTFTALILAADNFKIKKNIKNVILFIGGLLSMSLAFYVIVGIGFFLKSNTSLRKKISIACISILLLLIILVAFRQTIFVQEFLNRFFNLFGISRYDAGFSDFFNSFLNGDTRTLLLGNGKDAYMLWTQSAGLIFDASTYKILIYDYGILGLAFIVLWFLLFPTITYKGKFPSLVFTLLFILSIYQRPYVVTFTYLTLFITGNSHASNFTKHASIEYGGK